MADLLTTLESFNRKERFFLVAQALNGRRDKPAFEPNADFLKELCGKVDAPVPEKGKRVFVAMDYHLDWLYASLVLAHPDKYGDSPFRNDSNIITGNQRDADLLVAFQVANCYHLILVEAKCYGSWDNDQMNGKATRLKLIFGNEGGEYPDVRPYFSLMSPNESQHLNFDTWPAWMLGDNGNPYHLTMDVPAERRRAERCDENGRTTATGGHFHCPFD